MAFIQIDCYSESLGFCVSFNAIVPQLSTEGMIGMKHNTSQKKKYPVLYLLHGLSDDHTIWMRRTAIERHVGNQGDNLCVIMPNVHRSFYTDMKSGYNYFTFISEELPRLVSHFLPISTKREDTFLAGLSMGGYGAFKVALLCPDKFAAAASLSGALDMAGTLGGARSGLTHDLDLVFGKDASLKNTKHDLLYLVRKVMKSKGPRPRLYQCCGTADFLYQDNLKFRDHALKIGYDLTFEEEKDANHDWGYWDRSIEKILRWLPVRK